MFHCHTFGHIYNINQLLKTGFGDIMTGRDKNLESKISMRKMREDRKLQGLCISCGAEKVPEGSLNCNSCKSKRNRHEREQRKYRKDKSLCTKCGKKLDRVGAYCTSCVSKVTEGTRRFRSKNPHS